ncbi:hypothetical protein BU25DRAFT_406749 [Macroventuria anomochaeta]|uniref:Uncharacterized protein n=1 Tax=Macroventuria anomochaeta TaxID=301207 RepID=A0ACB6SE26_9PLEO|nr:uncharacterized protein BU25DRAFT_406749 [Macroventuria anomochaeta]KAF2632218.1 hypothetical protein BU25DRAFT_406749 [Macroventuria anomochaeta]
MWWFSPSNLEAYVTPHHHLPPGEIPRISLRLKLVASNYRSRKSIDFYSFRPMRLVHILTQTLGDSAPLVTSLNKCTLSLLPYQVHGTRHLNRSDTIENRFYNDPISRIAPSCHLGVPSMQRISLATRRTTRRILLLAPLPFALLAVPENQNIPVVHPVRVIQDLRHGMVSRTTCDSGFHARTEAYRNYHLPRMPFAAPLEA